MLIVHISAINIEGHEAWVSWDSADLEGVRAYYVPLEAVWGTGGGSSLLVLRYVDVTLA